MKQKKNNFVDIIAKARKRIEAMDKQDGGNVLEKSGLDQALRTIMTAIKTGIEIGDWNIVGDAFVMTQQIELHYRPAGVKVNADFFTEEAEAMIMAIIAEYGCGHGRQVILKGEWAKVREELNNDKSDISFKCKKCGRGARTVVTEINGKEISRDDTDQMRREGSGGTFSVAPKPDNN